MYSFFQQKTYQEITHGREKVLTQQKPVRILKKNSEHESQINLSHLNELLKSYKPKYTRRSVLAAPSLIRVK